MTVLLLDVVDGVATVTLNRPESLNSLSLELKVALRDTLDKLADDPGVRAIVLTGAGRAFCVGQDLREHTTTAGRGLAGAAVDRTRALQPDRATASPACPSR